MPNFNYNPKIRIKIFLIKIQLFLFPLTFQKLQIPNRNIFGHFSAESKSMA